MCLHKKETQSLHDPHPTFNLGALLATIAVWRHLGCICLHKIFNIIGSKCNENCRLFAGYISGAQSG